jgi:hypothetical protein
MADFLPLLTDPPLPNDNDDVAEIDASIAVEIEAAPPLWRTGIGQVSEDFKKIDDVNLSISSDITGAEGWAGLLQYRDSATLLTTKRHKHVWRWTPDEIAHQDSPWIPTQVDWPWESEGRSLSQKVAKLG